MTLCVAWRYDAKVCMAADSAIVYPDGKLIEFGGIKVLAVPVKVIGPSFAKGGVRMVRGRPQIEQEPGKILYEHTAGMCFTGSYAGAFLLKEIIAEALANLQTISDPENLSFADIAAVAFQFYRHFFKNLKTPAFAKDERCHLLLGGYCPSEKRIRVFHLQLNSLQVPSLAEDLHDGERYDYVSVGSGQPRFDELFGEDLKQGGVHVHFRILRRIRDVIREGVHNVAGAIQYGEFDERTHDFRLFGVVEPVEENGLVKHRWYIRGTDLEQAFEQPEPSGLHVTYRFLDPFSEGLPK